MKVFLSYASKDRPLAERVCRVLETEGYDVFFDHDDLGGGDAFGERIRTAIQSAHVLVYLISQSSVTPPSYALTELGIATALSPRRRPAILPVRMDTTPIAAVPAALRAYTILEPQGDVPAEIAAAIDRIGSRIRKRRLVIAAAAVVVLGLGAGGYLVNAFLASGPVSTAPAVATAAPSRTATAGDAVPTTRPPTAPVAEPTSFDPAAGPVGAPPFALPVTPDAMDAFNDSVLKRTPPDRLVTLMGAPGADGWSATVILVDQTVTKVQYRLDGETAFSDTGSSELPSPFTGQMQPNTFIQLPGAFWRPRHVTVKYTDAKGRDHGPFEVAFDPRAQFARFTRQSLGFVSWVSFSRNAPKELLAYFTTLLAFKAAFREIRYSIDSDALDRVLPLKVDPSEGWPSRMSDDVTFIKLPASTTFLTVKLTFVDGTMQTRKLEVPAR
jgi:hypothetical protein